MKFSHKNISIRTEIKSGDLGYFIYRHGKLYNDENGYKFAYLWITNEQETATKLYEKSELKLTEEKEFDAFGKRGIEQKFDLLLK